MESKLLSKYSEKLDYLDRSLAAQLEDLEEQVRTLRNYKTTLGLRRLLLQNYEIQQKTSTKVFKKYGKNKLNSDATFESVKKQWEDLKANSSQVT